MEEDIKLIEASQNGDNKAFGGLYDKYVKSIYKFVYFKTHHKETAEDLTSKTFMKALENIKSYQAEKASFSVWLYKIARNTVIDHYRTKKFDVNLDDVWNLSSEENILMDTDARLKMEKVREYMRELNVSQREIIMMRVWQGMNYKEIAEVTGKNEANCRMVYLRGIKILKDKVPFSVYLFFLIQYFK